MGIVNSKEKSLPPAAVIAMALEKKLKQRM
jgi:hypothetical protein